ncbi:MAG: diphthine--ammonia ligase [Chitinivibrionales bacterium]|nr:diphthine--ammonia ligase [Chitinivibrionales bacterium]
MEKEEKKNGFFCSWSGGKDSCLALYKSLKKGLIPRYLLTMMAEAGTHSRSHGLSREMLLKQSQSLGIPIFFRAASWAQYEATFIEAIHELKRFDIHHGVFGDIDIEEHRQWVTGVCARTGIESHEPLWHYERMAVVEEFVAAGFKAIIVAVKKSVMEDHYLGKELSVALCSQLAKDGIDAAGENGEFHSFVFEGPLFKESVSFQKRGIIEKDGTIFLDIY